MTRKRMDWFRVLIWLLLFFSACVPFLPWDRILFSEKSIKQEAEYQYTSANEVYQVKRNLQAYARANDFELTSRNYVPNGYLAILLESTLCYVTIVQTGKFEYKVTIYSIHEKAFQSCHSQYLSNDFKRLIESKPSLGLR